MNRPRRLKASSVSTQSLFPTEKAGKSSVYWEHPHSAHLPSPAPPPPGSYHNMVFPLLGLLLRRRRNCFLLLEGELWKPHPQPSL